MLEEARFDMASPRFYDTRMDELDKRAKSTGKSCQALKLWKEEPNDGTVDDKIIVGMKVLTEVLHVILCIKRSGITYDKFRRDFSDGHDKRSW